MSTRAVTLAVLPALCLLVCAVGSAPAFASAPMTFATQGHGAGQVEDPSGVAVDQPSGDVYVAETGEVDTGSDRIGNDRIDRFGFSGAFLMAWGYGVADGSTLALQSCGPEAPLPTSVCFQGLEGTGAGAVRAASVEVDQSTGDVYVIDEGNRRVEKFSTTGQFLLMFGKEVNSTTKGNICTAANLEEGDTCGAGKSGTGKGQFFNDPTAIAVNSSGDVWVGDKNRLEEFNSSGECKYKSLAGSCESEIEIEEEGTKGGETVALAVDSSGDLYVESASLKGVRELNPTSTPSGGKLEGKLEKTFDKSGKPEALALDSSGDVFVGDATSPYRFMEFDSAGEQIEQFGAGQVIGSPRGNALAVGETAASLYVVSSSVGASSAAQTFSLPRPGPLVEDEHAETITSTAVTLAAGLNPEDHATTYYFQYGTSTGYGKSTIPTVLSGSGFGEEAIKANLSDLIPATTYHFRLVAEDAEGRITDGPDVTFSTLPAVQIGAQWATEVAAANATVHGELNPLGVPAIWWVQYGPSERYGSSMPAEDLASGSGSVSVESELGGLPPASVLHYRFVARDERDGVVYTTYGADHTLTTQTQGEGLVLPDGREWEMVSPPNKNGALIGAMEKEGGVAQAAAGGGAFTWAASLPVGTEVAGSRTFEWSQIFSTRGADGWSSRDIAPPNEAPAGYKSGNLSEYQFFSSDLSLGLVEPKGETPLSPEATEKTIYLREDADDSFLPLVTKENVPPGTKFGGSGSFEGASPDLSHVVFESEDALTPNAPVSGSKLYEWAGGELQLVSVPPASESSHIPVEPKLGYEVDRRHAISNDGSRVIWTSGHLYMRDMTRGETIELDAEVTSPGEPIVTPKFQTASDNGRRVFFTDEHMASNDLYQFETTNGEDEPLKGELTNLTVDHHVGESADVQGLLPGASEDGSYVYLVATGVLSEVENAEHEKAAAGADNLYVLHDMSGSWTTTFIAQLSGEDAHDWTGDSSDEDLMGLTSRVSPDGRYLAFMSDRELTGYDNHDANSGKLDEEVFLYDAEADAGAGRLVCASCDPTGARPVGVEDKGAGGSGSGSEGRLLVDEPEVWEGRWLAGSIPGWTPVTLNEALYQSRYLSDSGRLFFDSSDALVPQDVNGTEDVYEYEPPEVGSCTTFSATFSERSDGCVDLISSGASAEESMFLDASESGGDVFFLTTAKLATQDYDTSFDVYDAHECTSQAPCVTALETPPQCTTPESCRAPSAPQPTIFGAPPSQTFSGAGNTVPSPTAAAKAKPVTRAQKLAKALKACKQKPKKKRPACVRHARKEFGQSKKAKK